MISGDKKALAVAKPILEATSEMVFEFGETVGSGSL